MKKKKSNLLAKPLVTWFKKNGRKFPWRKTKNPYRIFIAETLLQKTNVEKVYPAYLSIVKKYPTVSHLTKAKLANLRKVIAPLGLVKRARFLKEGAKGITRYYGGKFPQSKKELKKIINIGDYMAHAILCFAYDARLPLVDTNVARVYKRLYNFKCSKLPYADKKLWAFSAKLLPRKNFKDYNLAVLDLSALLCRPRIPLCYKCPCAKQCFFKTQR